MGHPPPQSSEHREGCSIQRSSAYDTNLRWRRHSQQIETSSCRGDDVSLADPHTLAQQEAPMSMPLRLLVERRDDVSLPAVMGRRSRDRRAPVLLLPTTLDFANSTALEDRFILHRQK